MKKLSIQNQTTEFLLYTTPNGDVKVETLLHEESLWLTQQRMAELFGVQRPAISKHLKNIFESGELKEEVVCSILETTTQHGAIEGKTQTQKVNTLTILKTRSNNVRHSPWKSLPNQWIYSSALTTSKS